MKQKAKPKAARRAAAKKAVKKTARRGAVSATAKPKPRRVKATARAVAKPKVKSKATARAVAKPKVKAKAPVRTKSKAKTKAAKTAKTAPVKKALAKRPARARAPKPQARPAKSLIPPPSRSLADLLDADTDTRFAAPAPGAAPNAETAPNPETAAPDTGDAAAPRDTFDEGHADSGETLARVNKLVPTNAVHTTKRRAKRNTWQTPVLGLTAVAAVLAIMVLGHERAPPDVSPLERRAELGRGEHAPNIQDPLQAAPERALETPALAARPAVPQWGDQPKQQAATGAKTGAKTGTREPEGLKVLELVELERMLDRLEMGPSRPDGIVDRKTASAIRMYQQIAGLPVDGEPSVELLDDMREVVKLLDGVN